MKPCPVMFTRKMNKLFSWKIPPDPSFPFRAGYELWVALLNPEWYSGEKRNPFLHFSLSDEVPQLPWNPVSGLDDFNHFACRRRFGIHLAQHCTYLHGRSGLRRPGQLRGRGLPDSPSGIPGIRDFQKQGLKLTEDRSALTR